MRLKSTNSALVAAVALVLPALTLSAEPTRAQTACTPFLNPNSCIVAPGVTIQGDVTVFNSGSVLTNAGTITGDASGFQSHTTVLNSGLIQRFVEMAGTYGTVVNTGHVVGDVNFERSHGTLINYGTIGSFVFMQRDHGSITNYGDILGAVTAQGAHSAIVNYGSAEGLFADNSHSSIENHGVARDGISLEGENNVVVNAGRVDVDGAGTGIRMTGSNSTLTLLPGSSVEGRIEMAPGGTLNVGPGLSIMTTFSGPSALDVFGLPDVINTFGAPFAVSGLRVAVVDPTLLSLEDERAVDVTSSASDVVAGRLNRSVVEAAPSRPTSSWAEVFGSRRLQESTYSTASATLQHGGVIGGFDRPVGGGGTIGLFFGGVTGETKAAAGLHDEKMTGAFAGFYARKVFYGIAIDSVTSGWMTWQERERSVSDNLASGGLASAKASFNGSIFTQELGVSIRQSVLGLTIVPSMRLRYVGLYLDGYAETGSADNLAVDDRDRHVLLGRAQVLIPTAFTTGDGGQFQHTWSLGVEARTLVGGRRVEASLLGQDLSFDAGGDTSVVSAFGGLSMSYKPRSSALKFQAGGLTKIDMDGSSQLTVRAGFALPF